MVVKAKSLKLGGKEIKAIDATYETYVQHLCRCSECGSEVYLAAGKILKPHWRHFPGQGKRCPSKSISRLTLHNFDAIQRQQCRAQFKSRFLEILDIGWIQKGYFTNREASKNVAFFQIPVPGYREGDCIIFEELLQEVNKLRRNLTACKAVLHSALHQALTSNIKEWDLKELQEIQYKQHSKICVEALEYLFGNGRQDLLKEVLAKVVVMYAISGTHFCEDANRLRNFRKNDPEWKNMTTKDFPLWCITAIITNLIHVPWQRIMSDLNQGIVTEIREDKFVWLFPGSKLGNIKEIFGLTPRAKASVKSKKGFRQ